jgi:hypothetical protein
VCWQSSLLLYPIVAVALSVCEPLLSNSCCMCVLQSSPSCGSACHVASSLRLSVLIGLQVYCHVCGQFPNKVQVGPLIIFVISEGCALDVSSFTSEGADPSTMSCHSVPKTVWKSALFASQSLSREFVHELQTVSSHFPDIAFVLHLSTLCHCCAQCIFSNIHPLGAPHIMFFLAGS